MKTDLATLRMVSGQMHESACFHVDRTLFLNDLEITTEGKGRNTQHEGCAKMPQPPEKNNI
ncbi:MAG: hypothetical protein JSW72_06810, partial [Candidatus Bathyarchaeota archaeon]